MPLTMPEELILLMLDDQTGRLHEMAGPASGYTIAGAILAELALRNRIDHGVWGGTSERERRRILRRRRLEHEGVPVDVD